MNQHERAKGGLLYAVRGRYSAEKLHSEGFEYCDVWGSCTIITYRVSCKTDNEKIYTWYYSSSKGLCFLSRCMVQIKMYM